MCIRDRLIFHISSENSLCHRCPSCIWIIFFRYCTTAVLPFQKVTAKKKIDHDELAIALRSVFCSRSFLAVSWTILVHSSIHLLRLMDSVVTITLGTVFQSSFFYGYTGKPAILVYIIGCLMTYSSICGLTTCCGIPYAQARWQYCGGVASLNCSIGCSCDWRSWHGAIYGVFIKVICANSLPSLDQQSFSWLVHGTWKVAPARLVASVFLEAISPDIA